MAYDAEAVIRKCGLDPAAVERYEHRKLPDGRSVVTLIFPAGTGAVVDPRGSTLGTPPTPGFGGATGPTSTHG